jgi:hypothetical protein
MLYGRRIIHSQRPQSDPRQNSLIVSRSFQHKYVWYFVTALAGSAMLFMLPSFFFVKQNYELFKTLAYDTQPMLVRHLEREVNWLSFFMVSCVLCFFGFTLFLSIRMTKSLVLPLLRMEKHMHQLMLGQWNIPNFDVDEQDDFRELSMTYDYFYRSLKASTENDLRLLEKLSIDSHDREAHAALRHLINEKRNRLGIQESVITHENVVELNGFDQKRRAS